MSEFSVKPGYAYDILKGRNFCHPFTFSRRFSNDWDIFPSVLFDLFKTENGYETVIDKFVVMFDFGPFGTTNVFRAGLRANGRLMDGYRDATFTQGDAGFGTGTGILRSNGFVPVTFLNGINDFNFMYRALPGQQISCQLEQFDTSVVVSQQRGIILVSGAQLAA